MTAPTAQALHRRPQKADRDGDGYSNAGDPFPDDANERRTATVITVGQPRRQQS